MINLADLISTELGVDDNSAFATPEAMRAAIAAVLDLTPPAINSGDDPEMHAMCTDGWWTCHSTVVRAIAEQLGLIAED